MFMSLHPWKVVMTHDQSHHQPLQGQQPPQQQPPPQRNTAQNQQPSSHQQQPSQQHIEKAAATRKRLPPSPAIDKPHGVALGFSQMKDKYFRKFHEMCTSAMVSILNAGDYDLDHHISSSPEIAASAATASSSSHYAGGSRQARMVLDTEAKNSSSTNSNLLTIALKPQQHAQDSQHPQFVQNEPTMEVESVATAHPSPPAAGLHSSLPPSGSFSGTEDSGSPSVMCSTPILSMNGPHVAAESPGSSSKIRTTPQLVSFPIPSSPSIFIHQSSLQEVAKQNSPDIANHPMIWQGRSTPEMIEKERETSLALAKDVLCEVRRLFHCVVKADGKRVDYQQMFSSTQARQFLKSVRLLRDIDPSLLSEKQKLTFFLNLYNALTIHALAVLYNGELPKGLDRLRLYATSAYDIGGRIYTLNDMEHGILRANRPPPGPLVWTTFNGPRDARMACKLTTHEPRIHFALNCGGVSCPSIQFYEEERIDEQLDLAVRTYLNSNDGVVIDVEKSTVCLSSLFHWYHSDFVQGHVVEKIMDWVVPFLDEERTAQWNQLLAQDSHIRFIFNDYDWSPNKVSAE